LLHPRQRTRSIAAGGCRRAEPGARLSAHPHPSRRLRVAALVHGAALQGSRFRPRRRHPQDPKPYLKITPKAFEHIRQKFGDELELLHDIHERVDPIDAINLCKELERYRPFFIEDPFAPEQNGYFRLLRQQCATPIAMGELFNNPHEWVGLITERLIDFIRVHLSQVGGLSVARKIAALAEWFGVRSAWHGPGDVSPVGHACNAHLDLAIHNFGIQEAVQFNQATQDVFPGSPTIRNGYMYVNEAPGFGVDLDEELAKKFPYPDRPAYWRPVRKKDGTSIRP
jgi:mannonate dehydratase